MRKSRTTFSADSYLNIGITIGSTQTRSKDPTNNMKATKAKQNLHAKTVLLKNVPDECFFCRSSVEDEAKLGKKYSKHGICIHYFCMLFASGLSQRGRSDREGILGFLVPDIKKEARRAARLRCAYCKQPTASIGCVKANCRTCFHFGCGVENGTLNQYFGNFTSYCFDHRPYQQVPLAEQKKFRAKKSKCVICMMTVLARPLAETMRTPCCKANSWYHKECLQRMASCSGLHFFKCPLCNNKDIFQKEMLDFGIYIPDRDAAWELEPNAFQELLERHNQCDFPECCCPEGRQHSKKNTPWEVVLCDTCGHMGCHMQCGKLSSPSDEWVCHECQEIHAKSSSLTVLTSKPTIEVKPARRRGRPLGSTSGYKRKISTAGSDTTQPKRARLALTRSYANPEQPHILLPNGSKENYDDRTLSRRAAVRSAPLSSKKTLDSAKIKSSTCRAQPRNLRYYVLGESEGTGQSVDRLQRGLRSASRLSAAGSNRLPCGVSGERNMASHSSAEARALRAWQRGKRDDEDQLIPNDSMPVWLQNHLKQDIFTGRNLGVKFLSLTPKLRDGQSGKAMKKAAVPGGVDAPSDVASSGSRLMCSQRTPPACTLSKTQSVNDKPQWLTQLYQEDFLCSNSIRRKLSAAFPSFQLAPGIDCRQQPTVGGASPAVPSGRGKHCSRSQSGHPGSLPSGHAATFQTQVSGSELENEAKRIQSGDQSSYPIAIPEVPKERKHMKYWDFVQHLEDIGGALQKPSLLDRLSLYQQFLDGEYELLSFADIKSATLSNNYERDTHSPTPSLVSPNDMPDDLPGSVDSWLPNSQDRERPSLTVTSPNCTHSNYDFSSSPSYPNCSSPTPSMMYPYSPSQSCFALRTIGASPVLSNHDIPSSPGENYDDVLLFNIDTPVESNFNFQHDHDMNMTVEPMETQSVDFSQPSQNTDRNKILSGELAKLPSVDSTKLFGHTEHAQTVQQEPTEPQSEFVQPHQHTIIIKTPVEKPVGPVDSVKRIHDTGHTDTNTELVQSQPVEPLRKTDQTATLPEEPREPQPVDFAHPVQHTDNTEKLSGKPVEIQSVQQAHRTESRPEEPTEPLWDITLTDLSQPPDIEPNEPHLVNSVGSAESTEQTDTNSVLSTAHTETNNVFSTGRTNTNNVLSTGQAETNYVFSTGQTDTNNVFSTGQTKPNNVLSTGHTDTDNMLSTGQTDTDNVLSIGQADTNNMPLTWQTDTDNMITTAQTDTNNVLSTGLTDTDNMLSTGHTDTDNVLSTGQADTDNVLSTGQAESNNMPLTWQTDTDNMVTTGQTDTNNVLSTGLTDTDNMLSTGHTDTDNVLSTGQAESNNMPLTWQTDTDNMVTTGQTDTNNGLSTGLTDTDNMLSTGHTDTDNVLSTGQADTDNVLSTGQAESNNMPLTWQTDTDNMVTTGQTDTNNVLSTGQTDTNNVLTRELVETNMPLTERIYTNILTEQTDTNNVLSTGRTSTNNVFSTEQTETTNIPLTGQTDTNNALTTAHTDTNNALTAEQTDTNNITPPTEPADTNNVLTTEQADTNNALTTEQADANSTSPTEQVDTNNTPSTEQADTNNTPSAEHSDTNNALTTKQADANSTPPTEQADTNNTTPPPPPPPEQADTNNALTTEQADTNNALTTEQADANSTPRTEHTDTNNALTTEQADNDTSNALTTEQADTNNALTTEQTDTNSMPPTEQTAPNNTPPTEQTDTTNTQPIEQAGASIFSIEEPVLMNVFSTEKGDATTLFPTYIPQDTDYTKLQPLTPTELHVPVPNTLLPGDNNEPTQVDTVGLVPYTVPLGLHSDFTEPNPVFSMLTPIDQTNIEPTCPILAQPKHHVVCTDNQESEYTKVTMPMPRIALNDDDDDDDDDDCVIIKIEDVRTLRPSDPHHIDIDEIATIPGKGAYKLTQKPPCRPLVIKADEISTVPGTVLIDLTDEWDDVINTVVLPTKQKRCRDCGKMRKKNYRKSVKKVHIKQVKEIIV